MVKIMPTSDHEDTSKSFSILDPLICRKSLRNLSYRKILPPQHLNVSVLKLDGSSFDVNVARNATVAELKQAAEEVFSSSPKEGEGNISWSHVWGHFCLCYEGKKLINDKVHIRSFGINDGDELKFIRNMSINYRPPKQGSKIISGASRLCSTNFSRENAQEDGEQTSTNGNHHIDGEDNSFRPCHYEDEDEAPMPKFKLAHFFNSRLSYSKLKTSARRGFVDQSRSSRFFLQYEGDNP